MAANISQEVVDAFQDFQRARVLFVQRVANLARLPNNVMLMQNAGIMDLVKPLLQVWERKRKKQKTKLLGADEATTALVECAVTKIINFTSLLLWCGVVQDNVPSIQQGASVTLGRLASKSEKVAQSVVRNGLVRRPSNVSAHLWPRIRLSPTHLSPPPSPTNAFDLIFTLPRSVRS